MDEGSDDDSPQLSAHALAALQEFLVEQQMKCQEYDEANVENKNIEEDWNLSQFWYSDETAEILAKEVIQASEGGRIACLCAPTLYKKLRQIKPDSCQAFVFEYDKRFDIYGEDYVFYDYHKPLELPEKVQAHSFDLVFVDPPYLNKECLTDVAKTVKHIMKEKVVLCTGQVMEEAALELLNVKPCKYLPKHDKNLANEFRCYVNYDTELDLL